MSFAAWMRAMSGMPKVADNWDFIEAFAAVASRGCTPRERIHLIRDFETMSSYLDSALTWDETPYQDLFSTIAYAAEGDARETYGESWFERDFPLGLAYCLALAHLRGTEGSFNTVESNFQHWEDQWIDFVTEYPRWAIQTLENLLPPTESAQYVAALER